MSTTITITGSLSNSSGSALEIAKVTVTYYGQGTATIYEAGTAVIVNPTQTSTPGDTFSFILIHPDNLIVNGITPSGLLCLFSFYDKMGRRTSQTYYDFHTLTAGDTYDISTLSLNIVFPTDSGVTILNTGVNSVTDDLNVTGIISQQELTLGWQGTLAAGRLNPNVVQGVISDTNVIGSIAAQDLTLGWTGTLAAARLNSNVVQAVTSDTNITGNISAQALTLGWTGTLASSRLNSNVVQNVVSDTNVTGTITAQTLTLAWSGLLPVSRGGTGASSAGLTGGTGVTVSGTWPNQTVSALGGGFLFTYIGPLAGIPATATVGQLAFITDATPAGRNIYECAATNAWTQQFAATGSISAVQSLDVSTFSGADLGAKINSAITSAPAAGCILDLRNFASPQTLSTAVNISGHYKLLGAGMTINQSATITLSGAGASIIGTQGRSFVFTKAGNIDQIVISGTDCVVDNITLNGVGGTYTGNGITLNNGTTRPILSNSTISAQASDGIHNLGTTDLSISDCLVTGSLVHGYHETTYATRTRILNSQFVDSASSSGSLFLPYAGIPLYVVNSVFLSSAATVCIDGSVGAILQMVNCQISQTNGYSAVVGGGGLFISNCQISGGGVNGPCMNAGSGGNFYLSQSTVQGQGVNDCIYSSGDAGNGIAIIGNLLSQTFTTGAGSPPTSYAIVHINGDTLSPRVANNHFQFQDSSPAEMNYGLWMQCQTVHCIGCRFTDNVFSGNGPDAYQCAIYIDNRNSVGTNGGHVISGNYGVDIGGIFIKIDDTSGYFAGIMMNNTTNGGEATGVFVVNGGLGLRWLEMDQTWSLSTVPGMGNGSIINMSSSLPTNPVRSETNYPLPTVAFKSGSNWISMASPVVVIVNRTGISAAITSTFLTNQIAAGQYLVNWNAVVTTPGTVSSTLGNFGFGYTNAAGNTISLTCPAFIAAGTLATSSTGNTTATVLQGVPFLIDLHDGAKPTYLFNYASSGATAMVYNLNITLEIR